MNNLEKLIVLAMLFGQPMVIFLAIIGAASSDSPYYSFFIVALPATVVLSIFAFIVVVRDLYKRDFENKNSKLNWILIFAFTGGIGFIFYIFWHGFKPRKKKKNGVRS